MPYGGSMEMVDQLLGLVINFIGLEKLNYKDVDWKVDLSCLLLCIFCLTTTLQESSAAVRKDKLRFKPDTLFVDIGLAQARGVGVSGSYLQMIANVPEDKADGAYTITPLTIIINIEATH